VVDRKVEVVVGVELDKDEEVKLDDEVEVGALSVLVEPKEKLRIGGPEISVTVGVGPPKPTGAPVGLAPMPVTTGLSERSPRTRNMIKIATVESTDAALIGMLAYSPTLRQILPLRIPAKLEALHQFTAPRTEKVTIPVTHGLYCGV
jgi:hypothetical protein